MELSFNYPIKNRSITMSWRLSAGDAWQPPCHVGGGRIAGRRVIARPLTRRFIPRDGTPSPHLAETVATTEVVAWRSRPASPHPIPIPVPIPVSLGAASAGRSWRWAAAPAGDTERHPPVERAPLPTIPTTTLRMSALLMRMMDDAARASGRDAAEVWAEAAREWLRQRDRHDDEPQPPAPVAAALAVPRRDQVWCGIDAVLADLRAPRHPSIAA
jgi:hypothetical protein